VPLDFAARSAAHSPFAFEALLRRASHSRSLSRIFSLEQLHRPALTRI